MVQVLAGDPAVAEAANRWRGHKPPDSIFILLFFNRHGFDWRGDAGPRQACRLGHGQLLAGALLAVWVVAAGGMAAMGGAVFAVVVALWSVGRLGRLGMSRMEKSN